ncbi:MAG: lysophospholipase [Phycisphaeraceae bacterium]|nr:lysophospholipase [Phycisphaeraceae bacterium]
MIGKMVSNMMIKPGKSPVFDRPEDFDLDYENVEFKSEDGVTLRGWLIKGGKDKVVIQSHFGVQCSRAGYSPKGKGMIKMWKQDISFLRQAKHLREQGYSVLMYDLRNHGESDSGSCPWISWGPEESKDVIAAVNFISTHPDYKDAGIGLLSICMGASSTTYGFGIGEQGLSRFPNLKAMIALQPLHYNEFVKAFGMPGFLNKPGGVVSKQRLGFDLSQRTFMPDVSKITIPTMVMQNRADPWTDLDFVQGYYDALQVEKEMKWLDLDPLRAAAYDYLGTHPEELSVFFDRYV